MRQDKRKESLLPEEADVGVFLVSVQPNMLQELPHVKIKLHKCIINHIKNKGNKSSKYSLFPNYLTRITYYLCFGDYLLHCIYTVKILHNL